jgi:hypothetical protein
MTTTPIRWSPEEDAILTARWPDETPDAIGADLGRSTEGVKSRARKLRLSHHKVGRRTGMHLSEESHKSFLTTRFDRKEIRANRGKPIARDPFIAVLFGACDAIKATVLPSRVFKQSMSIDEEELAA